MLYNRIIAGHGDLTEKEYRIIYMLKALLSYQQHEKAECKNDKKLKRNTGKK